LALPARRWNAPQVTIQRIVTQSGKIAASGCGNGVKAMEILIITASEKPSSLLGVRVFDGVTVSGEKCLVLQGDSRRDELAAAEPWRPLWQHAHR
jgi:hypothetical protein